jgi:hypothetical protein
VLQFGIPSLRISNGFAVNYKTDTSLIWKVDEAIKKHSQSPIHITVLVNSLVSRKAFKKLLLTDDGIPNSDCTVQAFEGSKLFHKVGSKLSHIIIRS